MYLNNKQTSLIQTGALGGIDEVSIGNENSMEPSQQIIFDERNAVPRKSSTFMFNPGIFKFQASDEDQVPTPVCLKQPNSNDKLEVRDIPVPIEKCFQEDPKSLQNLQDSFQAKVTSESSINSLSSKQILP